MEDILSGLSEKEVDTKIKEALSPLSALLMNSTTFRDALKASIMESIEKCGDSDKAAEDIIGDIILEVFQLNLEDFRIFREPSSLDPWRPNPNMERYTFPNAHDSIIFNEDPCIGCPSNKPGAVCHCILGNLAAH